MSTVRFFFEDTKNYGHQSHTIQVAERILKGNLIKNIGTVEFVYEEKEQGKNNERIKHLMSKYDYDKEKNEYIINNIRVSLKKLPSSEQIKEFNYGFCGGYDRKAEDAIKQLYYKIKVDEFLCIQPYNWSVPSFGVYKKTENELGIKKFFEVSKDETKDKTNDEIKYLIEKYDIYENIANNEDKDIEEIKKLKESYDIWPIYGLHVCDDDRQRTMIILRMLYLLEKIKEKDNIKKPVAILLLGDNNKVKEFTKEWDGIFENINNNKDGKDNRINNIVDQIIGKDSTNYIKNLKKKYKEKYKETYPEKILVQLKERGTKEEIKEEIKEESNNIIKEESKIKVDVIRFGMISDNAFNWLLKNSDLPFIFEGQGTVMKAISAGKPYFHIRVKENIVNNYCVLNSLSGSNSTEFFQCIIDNDDKITKTLNVVFDFYDESSGEKSNSLVESIENLASMYSNKTLDKYFCARSMLQKIIEKDKIKICFDQLKQCSNKPDNKEAEPKGESEGSNQSNDNNNNVAES